MVISLSIPARCLLAPAIHTPLWKVNRGDGVCWVLAVNVLLQPLTSLSASSLLRFNLLLKFKNWFRDVPCGDDISAWLKCTQVHFGLVPSFFPSIPRCLFHSCAGTHRGTNPHATPLITISSGATLYCFSSMLITSGLDPRFSQRAAKGDGVHVNVCVWGERSVCAGRRVGWVERSLLLPINCHTGFTKISQDNPGGNTKQHKGTAQPDCWWCFHFNESLVDTNSPEIIS